MRGRAWHEKNNNKILLSQSYLTADLPSLRGAFKMNAFFT
jgi:hypothetical protein